MHNIDPRLHSVMSEESYRVVASESSTSTSSATCSAPEQLENRDAAWEKCIHTNANLSPALRPRALLKRTARENPIFDYNLPRADTHRARDGRLSLKVINKRDEMCAAGKRANSTGLPGISFFFLLLPPNPPSLTLVRDDFPNLVHTLIAAH